MKTPEYKSFFISEVFILKPSKSCIHKVKLDTKDGINSRLAYITRTNNNNGLDCIVRNDQNVKIEKGNVITVGIDTQTVFYHVYDFITGINIHILKNINMNFYNSLFLVTIIKNTIKKFSWGSYGATLGRLRKTKILLPVDENGSIDWMYMENFIKEKELKIKQKILQHYENTKI